MISIIIPVFNQADKIGETFESILNQTFKQLEVIVVNDGSADNIGTVIENYRPRFSQAGINFQFLNQVNKGAPSARNAGYRLSAGEYLFFSDADAVLKPEAFQAMLDALEAHAEASYAYSSFVWGGKLFKVGPFSDERLKAAPFIHTMALIRRSDFPTGDWDESIKKLQDWDLWLTMLEAGKRGVFIDQVLFTIKPGGTISSWLPSFAYKLMPFLPQVKKYKRALEIVKKKHNL